jgi:ABC-2 type transport system ATP-binding protein
VRNLNTAQGVTVFLTTHHMDECERIADRLAIIDHGRIVAHGTQEQLRRQAKFADSLEEAFLTLTESAGREGDVGQPDRQPVSVAGRRWRR